MEREITTNARARIVIRSWLLLLPDVRLCSKAMRAERYYI